MKTNVLGQLQKDQNHEDLNRVVEQRRSLHDRAVFEALMDVTGIFRLLCNRFPFRRPGKESCRVQSGFGPHLLFKVASNIPFTFTVK